MSVLERLEAGHSAFLPPHYYEALQRTPAGPPPSSWADWPPWPLKFKEMQVCSL